jgi:uncharacterized protein
MTTPHRRTRGAFGRRWLFFVALLALGFITVLSLFENKLVYPKSTAAESWVEPPDADFVDVWMTSADGTKVHAWFLPGPTEGNVVVVGHGNGGNLSHRGRLASQLRAELGCAVMLFDYPGYGRSSGSPSEPGCYASGDAAIAWLRDVKQVPATRLILFGESLGGGVVTELAIRHPHRVLVLVKTFTTLPGAAKALFPMLPTHSLMRNRYDSVSKIRRIVTPVFVAHGTADRVVPFELGQALYAAANEPKQFLRLEGQDHNAWLTSDFFKELKRFLSEHAK